MRGWRGALSRMGNEKRGPRFFSRARDGVEREKRKKNMSVSKCLLKFNFNYANTGGFSRLIFSPRPTTSRQQREAAD